MSRNGTCDRLERSAKKELGDIWFKSFTSPLKGCAFHIDNPCAEAALPDSMDFSTRSVMSMIAVAYPEYSDGDDAIGMEMPSPRGRTAKRVKELGKIGCRVTAVHRHEVDHIHAYCPREAAESLIKLVEKTRFCGDKKGEVTE